MATTAQSTATRDHAFLGWMLPALLVITLGLYLLWKYDRDRLQEHPHVVQAATIEPQIQTGDLILFQAGDPSTVRRVLMMGRYTHVGIAYRRRSDNTLFVVDAGDLRALMRFQPMVHHYETSSTQGLVVVRRLDPPLDEQHCLYMDTYMQQFQQETECEHGGGGCHKDEATGEWKGSLMPLRDFTLRWFTTYIPLCTARHIFNMDVGYDKAHTEYCTDGLIRCLSDLGIVDTTRIPTCLLPNFFASNRSDQDLLNEHVRAPYRYGDEMRVTSGPVD